MKAGTVALSLAEHPAGLAVLLGVVFLAYEWLTGWKFFSQTINPASRSNIVNQGVSSIVQTASGGQYLNLGDWLYGATHPNQPYESGNVVIPITPTFGAGG